MTRIPFSARTRACSNLSLPLVFLMIGGAAFADDSPAAPTSHDGELVAPFVDQTTFLIIKLDPTRLHPPSEMAAPGGPTPNAKPAFVDQIRTLEHAVKQLRILADGQPLFATVGIPESSARTSVFFFRRKTSDQDVDKLLAFVKRQPNAEAYFHGDYVVVRPGEGRKAASSPAPNETRRAISAAFEAVADYPVQLLIVPPQHAWRTVRELLPELPRQLGGGPSSVLTEGVQWIAIGFDLERFTTNIVIQSSGNQAARDFAAHLPTMLHSAYQAATPIQSRIPAKMAKQLIDQLEPRIEGSQVIIQLAGVDTPGAKSALMVGIARFIEEKMRRGENREKFRRILIGMHNYHDVHGVFPPVNKYKGRLSWRVHLLPFVGEQALFEQFHLDESWDSAHNKTLLAKMPDIYDRHAFYRLQINRSPGYTTFLAPVGKKTIFGGAQATKISQITDGTSNTIALLEVGPDRAAHWTAPADFSFDVKNPLAGVALDKDGKWLCAFADGSVHQLRGDISPQTVLHLFQMNDGELVSGSELR